MGEYYQIDQVVQILKNDIELTSALVNDGFTPISGTYPLYNTEYIATAEILIDNNTEIMASTARELVESDFKKSALRESMGFGKYGRPSDFPADKILFLQVYYTYKYSAVKIFFRTNYATFLPEYDVYSIKDNAKKQLYLEAFMREFDRFTKMIDDIANVVDIDKIPKDYLGYLAQIIGYERDDYLLLTDASFRELLKNIIEIYRIKGTNYSFELFFNFLGFDITLQEFWFDKRYVDDGVFLNAYTSSSDKDVYMFYLTPLKPTDYILSGMEDPYLVTEDMIVGVLDLNQFDKYIGLNNDDPTKGYTRGQLLGDSYGYSGTAYTFFKTNVMQYNLVSIGTTQEPELTSNDLLIINHYVDFLTPLFIEKNVVLAARPYNQKAYDLNLMDFKRTIPQGDTKYVKLSGFSIYSIDPGDWGDTSGDSRKPAAILINDTGDTLYDYLLSNQVSYITLHTGDTNDGFYRIGFSYDGSINNFVEKDVLKTKITLAKPLPGGSSVDSGDSVSTGKWESMFHMYEGYYPVGGRFWISPPIGDTGDTTPWLEGDSFMTYYDVGDSFPSGDTPQIPNSPLKYGGHWISGFHIDTHQTAYDRGDSQSAYSIIKADYGDSYDSEDVLDEISSKINDGSFWNYGLYGVRERDLIPPLRETQQIGDTHRESSSLAEGRIPRYGMGLSYDPGDSKTLSEAYAGPYGDTVVRGHLTHIDKEYGDSQSKIYVYDPNHRFRFLSGDTGDTDWIQLFDMPDEAQEGTYPVVSVFIDGDTGDTTVVTLGDTLGGDSDGDSAGMVQVYLGREWRYGDSVWFMYDKDLTSEEWWDYALWVEGDTYANAGWRDVTAIGDSCFIVAFVDNDNSDYGTIRLGAFYGDTSGDSFIWKISNLAFESSGIDYLDINDLGDSLFTIIYSNESSLARVGCFTGDSITWKMAGDSFYGDSSTCLDSDKMYGDSIFIVSYITSQSHGMVRVGRFTGSGIDWKTNGDTFATSAEYGSICAFDNGKFIVGYRNSNNRSALRAGEYTGDSQVSWITSSIEVSSSTATHQRIDKFRNYKSVFAYSANEKGIFKIVGLTGDSLTISFGDTFGDSVDCIDVERNTDTSFLLSFRDKSLSKSILKVGTYTTDGYFAWTSGDTYIVYNSNHEYNRLARMNGDSKGIAVYKKDAGLDRLSIFQIPKI